MKQILLFSIALIGLLTKAQAQCNPSAQTSTAKWYLIPDSATGLKHACPGHLYTETIYIKALKDSNIQLQILPPPSPPISVTATIDSFVIDLSSTGLPAYISINSVPAMVNNKLTIKGDSLACVTLSGTVPANATPGSTALTFPIMVYANIGGTIDTTLAMPYNSYRFDIDSFGKNNCWPMAISDKNFSNSLQLNASPNPSNGNQIKFSFVSQQNDNFNFEIKNALGEIVYNKNIAALAGKNYLEIDAAKFPKGIYFYSLNKNNIFVSRRLVIQ